jgi:hypothetical protein
LADRLTRDGIEVVFDYYDLLPGADVKIFMSSIQCMRKILIVVTSEYIRKIKNRSDGVGFEYDLLLKEKARDPRRARDFIVVIPEGGAALIPSELQGSTIFHLNKSQTDEQTYTSLPAILILARLASAARFSRPVQAVADRR